MSPASRGFCAAFILASNRHLTFAARGPLALLTRYVTSSEIRCAGKARIIAHLKKTPHLHGSEALALRALECARAQHIAVPGEAATADLIRELASQALEARQKIARIEKDLESILSDHPDCALIRSLPGMGVMLTAEFLAAIGNVRRFTSANALAAAAGLASVQRQSGKRSGWRRACGGDKALKRVFYQHPKGPAFQNILRPQTERGQTPHPGPPRPRPSARQCVVDHAAKTRGVRSQTKSGLTYPLRSNLRSHVLDQPQKS